MALSTQPYKGARDFYPEDERLQKFLFSKMRAVAERFGYEEYDAPIIESLELYAAKSGDEIVNEQTYAFVDRGERQVAIRPEMTPTVSRMVAGRRQELAYPLRWYSIPNVWRYERPQRGRLREHWQLNIDIFGVEGIEAEHEVIELADNLLQAFNAKRSMYAIKINSRVLMDTFLGDYLGLDETQVQTLEKLIDRMHKIPQAEFLADADAVLSPSQRDVGVGQKLLETLSTKHLEELPDPLYRHESAQRLKQLLKLLHDAGISNAEFDMTIMRGFDYYTDIVFEMFDNDPENNRSMFGGGRYDGLVGLFGVEPVATVGFGAGDVTLANFLRTHKLLPQLHTETDMYVIILGDTYDKAQKVIRDFREMGLNVAVDISGRKIDKQIKTAERKGIRYVLFIGEKELADEQFTVKNLQTGEEEKHSAQRIVSIVKDYRAQ